MLNHSSNNTNRNQVDPKVIRGEVNELEKCLKNRKNFLKLNQILLKYKIKSFSDIELIQCENTKKFLLEQNEYIVSCVLYNNFSEFLSEKLQEKTSFLLPKEDLISRLVGSDEENHEFLETEPTLRPEILIDEYDFNFLYKANNIVNNIENTPEEQLKPEYLSPPTEYDIKILKEQLTSYHITSNFNSLTSTKNEFAKYLTDQDGESLYIYSQIRRKDYEENIKFYKNSLSFHKKVIKKYKNNIKSLEESIYNTAQLLTALTQHLEIPRLYALPTSNQLFKAINKKQTGRLEELDRKDQHARALLKQKILEDQHLSEDEKDSTIEKVNDPNTNALFELDRYLGGKLDPEVNIVLRAIRAIVFDAVQSKKVESHHHPIKFPVKKLHKLCGVTKKEEKGYDLKHIRRIRSILTRSSLTEKILVKDESNNIIKSTSFLLEVTFHRIKATIKEDRKGNELPQSIIQEQCTHITVKVSDFLFVNHINQLDKSYLQDVEGYIRFRKLNRTTIGNDLFLWFEIYLSIKDKIKELNLTTIIEALRITQRYKHSPKEVKNNIERTLKDMIEANTLIKDYKLTTGTRGQEKYIFTNARYSENSKLEVVETDNKNSTKGKNKGKKK